MQDNEKKPALRFKGFTDPWEQRKLSDIVEKVTEKNAGWQYIETFTNSAEFGIISQRDFFDHDISKIGSLDGYYVVHNEDFVYNPRISVTAPVGPINRNKLGRTGVMSPLYTVFRPHDIDTTYLEHFFKSEYWHSFMNFNGDSGARSDRFSIKDSVFFEMPIPTPDIEEQKKIGEFLTLLDTLITLHQRKYEKLVNIKKSMLDKMFPKNGASVPEIRFKGFTDPWEQRKLKELYFQLTERNTDLLPYQKTLSVATMSFKTDGNGAADTSLANYKRLRTGDIAFEGHTSKEFRYGRFVLNDVGDGIMSPRFSALRPLHEMPINFWKYYIHYEPIMRKVLVNSTKAGTMMNELVINDFLQGSILVPSMAEQQAIGRFFKQLDTLITLHQRKLEKLQNIKKSCLEKMFV